MTDIHHIKTYLVFFFICSLLVGILAYLYMPMSFFGLRSDALSTVSGEVSGEVMMSGEDLMSGDVKIDTQTSSDSTTQKRLRLTNLLLHYQSELTAIEGDKEIADSEKQEKIAELRQKIDNLQQKITALSH